MDALYVHGKIEPEVPANYRSIQDKTTEEV